MARTKSILFAIQQCRLNLVVIDGLPSNGAKWIRPWWVNLVVIWWKSFFFISSSFPTIWVFFLIFIFFSPLFYLFSYFFHPHSPFLVFDSSMVTNLFFVLLSFFFYFGSMFFPFVFGSQPQFSFFLLLAPFFSLYLILPIFSPCSYYLFFLFFSPTLLFSFFPPLVFLITISWPSLPCLFGRPKKIWLPSDIPPLLNGDWNSLVAQKVKCRMNLFFPKTITHTPTPFSCHLSMGVCQMVIEIFQNPPHAFLGNQKILVAMWWWGCVGWQSNCFGHCPTHLHRLMATKIRFQSPFTMGAV